MRRQRTNNGNTLVEVALGTLAAAVLAVTLSVMLFYGYTTWGRNVQVVDLHRDATLTMQIMEKKLQQASAGTVDLSQQGRIVVSNQGMSSFSAFYQEGSNLVYNPAESGGGTPFLLVQGRLAPSGFTHSNITRGVAVRLQLQHGMEALVMNGRVAFRN